METNTRPLKIFQKDFTLIGVSVVKLQYEQTRLISIASKPIKIVVVVVVFVLVIFVQKR